MENLELAMYCHAVGDALGNPFEFQIPTKRRVAASLLENTPLHYTDDTQLMLATVVGLATDASSPAAVQKEYLDWFIGQGARDEVLIPQNRLLLFSEYRAVRAPGVNTMTALAERLGDRFVANDSNGNGTIMRMLPFAFLPESERDRDSVITLAQRCAHYTHGGDEIDSATRGFLDYAWYRSLSIPDEFIMRGGRTAWECLILAAEAVDQSKAFEECMIRCIAHEGDSDTIAAVAGGLWAIHRGRPEFLDRYMARLQGQDALQFAIKAWETTYGPG